MDEVKLRAQSVPAQTLVAGRRVELAYDAGDYDGHNFLRAGLRGTVLAYATPELQRRQIWPRESYWVRLECDAPDGAGRLFDRDRLKAI
jgi:hypothetical protein